MLSEFDLRFSIRRFLFAVVAATLPIYLQTKIPKYSILYDVWLFGTIGAIVASVSIFVLVLIVKTDQVWSGFTIGIVASVGFWVGLQFTSFTTPLRWFTAADYLLNPVVVSLITVFLYRIFKKNKVVRNPIAWITKR